MIAGRWRYVPPPSAQRPKGYYGAKVLSMPAGPPGGRYKVRGVDRASKMDTSMVVTADSAENTKVKGELEGIVVTKVEWQGRR